MNKLNYHNSPPLRALFDFQAIAKRLRKASWRQDQSYGCSCPPTFIHDIRYYCYVDDNKLYKCSDRDIVL